MFDKDLFFSLCKKYNVEMSLTANVPMIKDNEYIHPITQMDIKQILIPSQDYFDYTNNNIKTAKIMPKFYFTDDYSIAC